MLLLSELSGWLPSLSFDFCYLLFNFASYWAFRLFEFSNGSWSVFCNFHLFEFSADNVYRLPLLLNSFLPEYQVCVAQYFLSNHIFELPEFSFHYDLRFVSSFGALSEISIADECFASLFSFQCIFCQFELLDAFHFLPLVLSLNSLVTSSRQITDAHQIEVIHFPPSVICQDGK